MEHQTSFTLSQLEYFLATLTHGSFTGAAESLGVSQPAVADQIARLERVMGQSLFARKTRGVSPTSAAREFEPWARSVVDSARDAAAWIAAAESIGAGTVAIGTFGSPHHYGLADLIADFVAANPKATLRIEGRNSSSTAAAVRAGELDAAIVALPVDETGLHVRPIFASEVFCVSADRARVAAPVSIAQVCDRPFIMYEASSHGQDPTRVQLEARAQAAGLRIQPHIDVEAVETALDLAARGIADTYVAQVLVGSLDPRLHAASFAPPLIDTFALITRAGSRLPRPLAEFLDQLTSHMVDLAQRTEAEARAPRKTDEDTSKAYG